MSGLKVRGERRSADQGVHVCLTGVANEPVSFSWRILEPHGCAVSRRQGRNVLAIRPGPWRAAERRRLEARQATRCGVVKSAPRQIETDI